MQSRSEVTRQKILSSATRLFSLNGYDGTGVAEICEAAGVSKGAFYHHFPSKQDVFLNILNEWLDQLSSQMQAARLATHDVPEGLVAMSGLIDQVFQMSRNHYSLFFEFWIQAMRHPEIWQTAIAPYHRFQTWLAAILQSGINEGSVDPSVPPDDTSRILIAMVLGLLLQAFFDPNGAAWGDVTESGIKTLVTEFSRRSL
ncbi:MAG: TetR/AcrR family transcriptional regulator [Anaerolineaceae bacterium]|jgi:AcrR family transcriptional regulator